MDHPLLGADSVMLNSTRTNTLNSADLRRMDPAQLTGPNDPFPDTSLPIGLERSTEFGFGVPKGMTGAEILQGCDETIAQTENRCQPLSQGTVFHNNQPFQQGSNGLLSRLSSPGDACSGIGAADPTFRCNQIESRMTQDEPEFGQRINLSFTIRSLTDSNGNLVAPAAGTYVRSVTEGGVTTTCTGSFTFNGSTQDANGDGRPDGYQLTTGSGHEC